MSLRRFFAERFAAITGVQLPAIFGWRIPTPVAANTSTYALDHGLQPGSRIYYIDPLGGAAPAAGKYYLWNGSAIIDNTGSLTGAGGVPYGADPLNPTGPVVAYAHFEACGPTRFSVAPGVRAGDHAVGSSIYDPVTFARPPDSPDWWLFKRGTTYNTKNSLASYKTAVPSCTVTAHASLGLCGGKAVGAEQVLGSYGPTNVAPVRIERPDGSAWALRSSRAGQYHLSPKNTVYMDMYWAGKVRDASPTYNVFNGFYNLIAADDFNVNNILYQGVVFEGLSGNNPIEQGPGFINFFRCVWVDHFTQPSYPGHSSAFHCGGALNGDLNYLTVTLDECFLARNGYKHVDPALLEGGNSTSIAAWGGGAYGVGGLAKYNNEIWVTTTPLGTGHLWGNQWVNTAYLAGSPTWTVGTAYTAGTTVNLAGNTSVSFAAAYDTLPHTAFVQTPWRQVTDLAGQRALGTIFDRNIYASGQTHVQNCTILRGASGEQFRQGSRMRNTFLQTGMVSFGNRYTSAPTSAGAEFKDNFLQGVSQYSVAPLHLNGYLAIGNGISNMSVSGNIISRVDATTPHYWEPLFLNGWDGHDGWDLVYPATNNVVTGNVFDSGSHGKLVNISDGKAANDASSFAFPALIGNQVVNNTLLGTGAANALATYTARVGAPATTDTIVSGVTQYADRAAYRAANPGAVDTSRTWKTYMQSLGIPVVSVDGVHEAVAAAKQMHRGNWDARMIGKAPVNYGREGWGLALLP